MVETARGETLPTVDTNFLSKSKLVQDALATSIDRHAGQKRKSGGPYVNHCVEVARIIVEEFGIKDEKLQAAALLHDTIEDTNLTYLDLVDKFGIDVANIVEGVTELKGEIKESEITQEIKNRLDFESLRKTVRSGYLDVRDAVLKLGDRLHNMRTLEHVPEDKRKPKAEETVIYATLAEALGMWKVKTELEDLAFKYSDPENYLNIKLQIENDPRRSETFIEYVKTNMERLIGEWQLNATINVKKPGIYELFRKRRRLALEGKTTSDKFTEIDDIVSFRIVTKDVLDSYKLLHFIHKNLKDVDYANMDFYTGENRNDNGYSAIHVPINSDVGKYEIALVNENDEKFNQEGVLCLIREGLPTENYKLKLIFTPDRKVLFLPREATGIDVAYALNSRLGAQAEEILIDGEKHTLAAVVPHASTVEIITSKEPRRIPKAMQFFMYCLPRTRKKIEEQFNEESKARYITKGKNQMEKELSSYGLFDIEDMDSETTDLILSFGCQTLDDLYYKIGTSDDNLKRIIFWLSANLVSKENTGFTSIRLTGTHDKEGLLGETSTIIMQHGGNISLGLGRGKPDKTFVLKFVVRGIQKKEDDLRKLFSENPLFDNCLIV